MDGRISPESLFKTRLNELYSAQGRRVTNRLVAEGIGNQGIPISEAYLSQLRSGARSHPSHEVVRAIANFFEVSTDHFYLVPWAGDQDRSQDVDSGIISNLCPSSLKDLLVAANGLSARSLGLLVDMTAKLRIADGVRVSAVS